MLLHHRSLCSRLSASSRAQAQRPCCRSGPSGSALRVIAWAQNGAGGAESSFASASSVVSVDDGGPDSKYRRNVGVAVVNSRGLVFAAQRSDSGCNSWQMPQGGIDEGENPEDAVLRELEEETSIRSARIVGSIDRWLTYDFPTEVRTRLHGGWTRYEGQAQRWFLVHFYGDDAEINLETEHKEFKAWQWMPLEELPGSVVEFKREVYAQVAAEFAPLIKQLQSRGELSKQPSA